MVTENIRDMNNWTYFLGGWKCINCGQRFGEPSDILNVIFVLIVVVQIL